MPRVPKTRAKNMFSLSPVEFHASEIEGRGVFARKRFSPGDFIAPYAPKQTRVAVDDPAAETHAMTKLTLLSGDHVIIPDTSVPGGWLSNHKLRAQRDSLHDRRRTRRVHQTHRTRRRGHDFLRMGDGQRRARAIRAVADRSRCRGFINFDLTTRRRAQRRDRRWRNRDDRRRTPRAPRRLRDLSRVDRTDHVQQTIANTFARMKRSA